MKKDWYSTDFHAETEMPWLYRATLIKKAYHGTEANDHDHCELCWAKFAAYPDCLHEGYCTLDERFWVCEDCFSHFRDQFEWKLEDIYKKH